MSSELKEAREKAGYSIEEVSDKLNIRKQYLISLEEGDYDSLPGKIYADGYTKMYYNYLGLTLPEAPPLDLKCSSTPIDEQKINSKQRKLTLFFSLFILIIVLFSYSVLSEGTEEINFTSFSKIINYGNN